MLLRGVIGCIVGVIIAVAIQLVFDLPSSASFFVGLFSGFVCTMVAINI
jgi:hypothetical protein